MFYKRNSVVHLIEFFRVKSVLASTLATWQWHTQQQQPQQQHKALHIVSSTATKALTFNYMASDRVCNAMKHGRELIKCARKKIGTKRVAKRVVTRSILRHCVTDGSRNNFRTINTIDNTKPINIYFILIYTRPVFFFVYVAKREPFYYTTSIMVLLTINDFDIYSSSFFRSMCLRECNESGDNSQQHITKQQIIANRNISHRRKKSAHATDLVNDGQLKSRNSNRIGFFYLVCINYRQ